LLGCPGAVTHARSSTWGAAPLEIHHRENPDAVGLDLVQERVRKSAEKTTTDRPMQNRSGFGMSPDGLKAPVNLLEEGGAESGLLKIVVLRCLV